MSKIQVSLFVLNFTGILWLMHGYFTVRLFQMFNIKARKGVWVSLLITLTIIGFAYLSRAIEVTSLGWLSRAMFYEIGWLVLILPWLLLLDALLLLSRTGNRYLVFCQGKYNPWTLYQLYKKRVAIGVLTGSIILTGYAWLQFHRDIVINHFTLTSPKVSQTYQLLHISDVQLGSVPPSHVEKVAQAMQQAIDSYDVDIILNTGDQVDSASYTPAQLAPIAYTSPPVIFSLGNHEFYHNKDRILNILQRQGHTILRSKRTEFKELNIIGIDDKRDPQQVATELAQQALVQAEKYNILLYHRPVGAIDAKQHGIDLMLSGHTHGGQIFPVTLIVKWLYEYPQGLTLLENFALYTTDGAGLWGPNLRLGTQNEIAVFTIKPEKGLEIIEKR